MNACWQPQACRQRSGGILTANRLVSGCGQPLWGWLTTSWIDLRCLVPLLMLLMMHQPHLHQPWRLDTCKKLLSVIQSGAVCGAGRGGVCVVRHVGLGRCAAHGRDGCRDALPDLAARALEPVLAAG